MQRSSIVTHGRHSNMNTQTTINRIYEYVEMVQGKQDAYWKLHNYKHSPSNEVDVTLGRRYAKVILKEKQ